MSILRDDRVRAGAIVLIGCVISFGVSAGPNPLAAPAGERMRESPARSQGVVDSREWVSRMVTRLFEGIPDSDHRHIVVVDEADQAYIAFHLSNWVGISELRAYWIPESEASDVSDLVEDGDHRAAFEVLVNEFGSRSRYVSDIGIDGLIDEEIEVEVGRLKDYFSLRQFETVEDADTAYRQWLSRALEILGR